MANSDIDEIGNAQIDSYRFSRVEIRTSPDYFISLNCLACSCNVGSANSLISSGAETSLPTGSVWRRDPLGEWDRNSLIGRLDKALTEAHRRAWIVVDMKESWEPGFYRKGWGVFGQGGFAGRRTSPIQAWMTIGLGGNTPFKSRPGDWFGAAYSFTNVSGDLKDVLEPLVRLRNEHQFEGFYNYAITPWLYLTGDVQVVRPTRPGADTSFVPGARLRIIF